MKYYLVTPLLIIPTGALPQAINLATISQTLANDAYNTDAYGAQSGLIIKTYPGNKWTHDYTTFNAQYGVPQPLQTTSYNLSRDLAGSEKLDFYNALPGGGPVDMDLQGNMVTCTSFISTANEHQKKAGCHTLVGFGGPIGCFLLTNPHT